MATRGTWCTLFRFRLSASRAVGAAACPFAAALALIGAAPAAADAAHPSRLTFTASTRTFSGTPATGDIAMVSVKVIASHGAASVSDTFDITVGAANAPKLSGARVLSDRTKLVLAYDRALDESSTPGNSAFAVKKVPKGGTESSVSLSGSPSISSRTVTLTLASGAVLATDTVTVTYTKPTTGTNNRIRSAGGGEAASFSNRKASHNRAPVFTAGTIPGNLLFNGQHATVDAPPGSSYSLPFVWSGSTGFSDPDGDALTRSTTTTRSDVIASGPSVVAEAAQVSLEHKSFCAMKALTPTVPDNHATVVTLTVTDPYGESASATRTYNTQHDSTFCSTLKSATVDGASLTLTYEAALEANLPGTLSASDFTVEVGGSKDVKVTAVSAGTVTTVGEGMNARKNKPYTLTLAEAVWGDQTVMVTYDPADADFHRAPIVTDHAVTVSTTNRRPTITLTQPTDNRVSPGQLVSFPVTFADPDIMSGLEIIVPGGTPTVAANALTVTFGTDPADVKGRLYYAGGNIYFRMGDFDRLCELTPRPDATFETDLTVTATDADGASRQAAITLRTGWAPETDCRPSLASASPATVDERTLTLTFNRALDEDSEPAARDFTVTVAGAARGVTGVDVSGSTVVLTLASAVTAGQTVTVSYAAHAARPIRLADGVGDPAVSFTNQVVENATGQAPVLESAVAVGAALTLLYDEALDETSEPATTDFAVTVAGSARGVSDVDVSGTTVVLTLASAVTAAQAVTVSYTKGANPIRDTHENHYEAAGFSGKTADNRTGDTTAPQLRSITVLAAKITLIYDEFLDPAHEPPTSNFIVNDGSGSDDRLTVTGVGVHGRMVVLTLALALTEARVATLTLAYDYDPLDTDTAIQDFAGNLASSISTSRNIPPGVRITWGGAPPPTPPPPPPTSGATLSGLALSAGAPLAFAPETTAYAVAVPREVASLTVTPTVSAAGATVTVNGAAVESGEASPPIALALGETLIEVVVTAANALATRTYTVTVTRAGPEVALFLSASDALGRQGFVRVVNHSDEGGEVSIVAIDDAGLRYAPVVLALDAGRTAHFNSADLEAGNPDKGLSGAVGEGEGNWRLELGSALDIEVLSYIRTGDGFVTSMHELAPEDEAVHRVVFMNPGSNRNQVSWLRLINPGEEAVDVTIEGTDDAGEAGESAVTLTLEAGASRMLGAQVLESGEGEGLSGRLGDGKGKWRLEVSAPQPIRVMSLLASPTGHLTNLSAATRETAPGGEAVPHRVHLVPSASDPHRRQGFVRVINHSEEGGEVSIVAIDDAGLRHAPVVLGLDAGRTTHFNSADLEAGNARKGLGSGVGSGEGSWRLELASALDIEVLSYIRTGDGFVTSMHDLVPEDEAGHRVVFMNPGSNRNQVSWLRLVNPGEEAVDVTIEGTDDAGEAGESAVTLRLEAGASRMLSAQALESGEGEGLSGRLGDGKGKWRLKVSAPQPIRVMSLLASPTGHLTNLSAVPAP